MNRIEIRELADKARNDPRVARGAFRKLALENGFKGQAGGWIYFGDNRAAAAQGWQGLADHVYFNPGLFAETLKRDEQDQCAAEAEAQLTEADEVEDGDPLPWHAQAIVDALNSTGEAATVRNIPLPAAEVTGIVDADGNALRVGDVVRVDGNPTLYGTVHEHDGYTWGIALGQELAEKIPAHRMRRVERQADGSFPAAPVEPFPISANGFTYSHVLGRNVKLTDKMQYLVRVLNKHGYIDPIRDGNYTNTIAALIDRGILRPSVGRYGIHRAASAPEQVWEDAHAEDDERSGGWGQPDGMMGTIEADQLPAGDERVTTVRCGMCGGHGCTLCAPKQPAPAPMLADRVCPTCGGKLNVSDPDMATCVDCGDEWSPDHFASPGSTPTLAAARRLAGTFGGTILNPEDALPTPVPAPTLADDVAALQLGIRSLYPERMHTANVMLAILDRIEATAPQQATDNGAMIQQHACGRVATFALQPPYCCANPGPWRALYVLPDGA